MNQKDFYPEFPLQFGVKTVKIVQNVWRNWLEDTDEQKAQSFLRDISDEKFDISTFIKVEDDQRKSLEILMKNYDLIKVFQKELLIGSTYFPQVDWDRCDWHAFWVICHTKIDKADQIYIRQVEICYISALTSKGGDKERLRHGMARMELYEYVLRLAKSWVT